MNSYTQITIIDFHTCFLYRLLIKRERCDIFFNKVHFNSTF